MNHRDIFRRLDSSKQARVLEAAIDEFAEQGFSPASMNRVVQRGGIAKGSLFQYFGSKEGLFRFIFDHAVELVRKSLRQVKQETAGADFFERISQSLLSRHSIYCSASTNLSNLSQDDLSRKLSVAQPIPAAGASVFS